MQNRCYISCLFTHPRGDSFNHFLFAQIIYLILQNTYVGWEDTIVSGWGTTFAGIQSLPDALQWVKVPPVSCNQAVDGTHCAGISTTDQIAGPCYSDFGGPLVSRDSVDTGYSLVGVTIPWICGQKSFYTEVSHYLPWIAEQYGLTFPSTADTSGRRKFK